MFTAYGNLRHLEVYAIIGLFEEFVNFCNFYSFIIFVFIDFHSLLFTVFISTVINNNTFY